MLFFISAAAAIIMATVWQIFAPRKDSHPSGAKTNVKEDEPAPAEGTRRITFGIVAMMIPIALAIIFQGMLRDGVTTWLPTLVSDTFDLPSSISILTGIILPIFSMITFNVSAALERKIKNELITSAVFYTIAALSATLLTFIFDISPIISVLLLALITGCIHGVNLMLISRVPRYFDKYGKISTVSGIVNAFTYVGSALSTYLVAVIAEKRGWGFTIASWLIIAIAGVVVCVAAIRAWTRFREDK